MAEMLGNKQEKMNVIKKLIERLHKGEIEVEEAKDIFSDTTKDLSPHDIAVLEEQLIKEGMNPNAVKSLCDVHIEVFREILEKEKVLTPEGHPIHILMSEHVEMVALAQQLIDLIKESMSGRNKRDEIISDIKRIMKNFEESEKHYLREENILFPELEKKGITQPPKIMWIEHDEIRTLKEELFEKVSSISPDQPPEFWDGLYLVARALLEKISGHFYKENRILFPTALKVVPKELWPDIRSQFDEIGYTLFMTPKSFGSRYKGAKTQTVLENDIIKFSSGNFALKELEALLDTLPVDITFVDSQDRVKYFNQPKDRFFVRSKSIIGRTVQNCHPQKSVHIVNKILDDFKTGKREVAEFWINLKGRLLYIRYFPVRSPDGEYLGTLEVTQDITKIKQLKGEKRLLDY